MPGTIMRDGSDTAERGRKPRPGLAILSAADDDVARVYERGRVQADRLGRRGLGGVTLAGAAGQWLRGAKRGRRLAKRPPYAASASRAWAASASSASSPS